MTVTDVRCQKGDAAFLIETGSASILFDTGFGFTGYAIADNIARVLGSRKLDYIFLTHSHYDHALATPCIKRRFPEATVVAGRYAGEIFQRPGAKRVMKELDGKFAATCGITDYECLVDELAADVLVDDGDVITAGELKFQVLHLPGHTKCSCGFYCPELKLFLSTESLGVYDGNKSIMPSWLVSYQQCMESIERVRQLDIEQLIAPHLGLLNTEQTAFFLKEMKSANQQAFNWMKDLITTGKTDDEIIGLYKERYWYGEIQEMYPIDAMTLNTGIQISLIRKMLDNTSV